jgi:hypothetical protein
LFGTISDALFCDDQLISLESSSAASGDTHSLGERLIELASVAVLHMLNKRIEIFSQK